MRVSAVVVNAVHYGSLLVCAIIVCQLLVGSTTQQVVSVVSACGRLLHGGKLHLILDGKHWYVFLSLL